MTPRAPEPAAFGLATVMQGAALAMVSGIAVEPIPIDRANWSTEFISTVAAAGGGITSRRVLVLFVAGQPTILTAMGV